MTQQIKPDWKRKAAHAMRMRFGWSELPYAYEDLGRCLLKAVDQENGSFVIIDFATITNPKVIKWRGPA